MDNETFNLILIPVLLIIVSFVFVRIAIRIRNFGGSMTTTLLGSTFDFMNKDKREAAETVVEQKSKKKFNDELNAKGKNS